VATRRRASRRTLTGSLSDIDRRLKFVETRPSPSRLANQVVRRTNIQPRAVATDQIQLLSITNSLIEKRTVGEAELDENSVTNLQVAPQAISTESFAPGAVDNAAMGTDSVSTDNYQNGSVTRDKLASDSVDEGKIENGSITTQKLANGSVTEPKIAGSAVTQDKINNGAVTESKIALNAVSSGKIQSGAVSSAKIQNGAVTTDKIADFDVTQIKIANGSVSTAKINGGASIATSISGSGGTSVSRDSETRGSSYTIRSPSLGYGSTQAAPGNHIHSYSVQLTSRTTDFEEGHRHDYGDRYISGIGGARASTSSKRFKRDISNYSVEDPKAILSLTAKKFKYKASKRLEQEAYNREWSHGYLVEDFLSLGIEEAISYDKEGTPTSILYMPVLMRIIELLKQQQSEIDSLKSELETLKDQR